RLRLQPGDQSLQVGHAVLFREEGDHVGDGQPVALAQGRELRLGPSQADLRRFLLRWELPVILRLVLAVQGRELFLELSKIVGTGLHGCSRRDVPDSRMPAGSGTGAGRATTTATCRAGARRTRRWRRSPGR